MMINGSQLECYVGNVVSSAYEGLHHVRILALLLIVRIKTMKLANILILTGIRITTLLTTLLNGMITIHYCEHHILCDSPGSRTSTSAGKIKPGLHQQFSSSLQPLRLLPLCLNRLNKRHINVMIPRQRQALQSWQY